MAKRGAKRDAAELDRFNGTFQPNVTEFVLACDAYRRAHDLRYMAHSDYFAVLHDDLGYRRSPLRTPAVLHIQRTVNAYWRLVLRCGGRQMRVCSGSNRADVARTAFKLMDMLRYLGVPLTLEDDGVRDQSRLFWGESPCVPESLPLTLRAKGR